MHNFPENEAIMCSKVHNLKEGKEIIKLCIDHDIEIASIATMQNMANPSYPRFLFNKDGELTQTSSDIEEVATVSLEEFKNFIQGKGDEKKISRPFEETLELSYDYKATVTKKNVRVGCTEFSHETIDALYALSQKARKAKK